jgi:hypothetical protein
VEATAELQHAILVMAVLVVVAVTTILDNEFLSELLGKETLEVDRIKVVMELLAVVAVQAAWVPMRLRNTWPEQEVLEFRR